MGGRVLSVGARDIFRGTDRTKAIKTVSEAKEEGADIIVSACNLPLNTGYIPGKGI